MSYLHSSNECNKHRDSHVVCLCGSMRFEEQMREQAIVESLYGNIVVMPNVNMKHADDRWADEFAAEHIKTRLDRLHFQKIDLADEIVVVCPGRYIGESTRREVAYAEQRNIPVRYHPVADAREHAPEAGEA